MQLIREDSKLIHLVINGEEIITMENCKIKSEESTKSIYRDIITSKCIRQAIEWKVIKLMCLRRLRTRAGRSDI
jgi:hypothetical protein